MRFAEAEADGAAASPSHKDYTITAWPAWALDLVTYVLLGSHLWEGSMGKEGRKRDLSAHTQQVCALLFVSKNHTVPVLIYKRIGNLEVTHFHWLLTNSSYERDSKHTVHITLYLNYFRFQSINKSASFDTKSLWLRLFIPTFMLCLLITLKFLFFFT